MAGSLRPLAAGLAVVALAGACGGGRAAGRPPAAARPLVATTVAPLTSIVAGVTGPRAEVRGLIPEGADSHTFEPRPRVAEVLSQADVVFVNGLGLDDAVRRLAEGNAKDGARVVALGERALRPEEYRFDRSFPRSGGRPNPHLWTDPGLARRYADVVRDAMVAADPAGAAAYRANHARFSAGVEALDAAARTALGTVAPERRVLLTYHDAYAYVAERYGWRVVGAIQVADFRDPTPREVAALIDQVRRHRVPAVFGSEVFPSPVLERIGREAGVRYVDVLRDDDLPGRPGDPAHSWLGLMRFDFVTIVEALGGDASALRALPLGGGPPDRAEYPQ